MKSQDTTGENRTGYDTKAMPGLRVIRQMSSSGGPLIVVKDMGADVVVPPPKPPGIGCLCLPVILIAAYVTFR
jgi:hypothetical protein